jgi:Ca2+-binding EF-hand superfamily protein
VDHNFLHTLLRLFDKGHTGFLTVFQLERMMSTLGEKMTREEVQEMMLVADGNNNGNINYKGT